MIACHFAVYTCCHCTRGDLTKRINTSTKSLMSNSNTPTWWVFVLLYFFFWLADMTNVLVLYFLLSQNAFWLQIFYSQCIYLRYKHLPTHSMLSQFYLYQNSKLKQNYFDYLKYIRYFYNHDTKRNPSSDTERGVHHCLMFNFTLFLSYDGHVLLNVNRSRLT